MAGLLRQRDAGVIAACLLAAGVASGCAPGPETPATGPQAEPTIGDGTWYPAPAAVRVFPSTRFVKESGQTLLEARIELLDAMGDPVKWPGEARFELRAASGSQPIETGGRLYDWRVGLLDREQQSRHYDPVTRTYLFRLIVDRDEVAARPTALRVSFTPPAGDRLSDEAGLGPTD